MKEKEKKRYCCRSIPRLFGIFLVGAALVGCATGRPAKSAFSPQADATKFAPVEIPGEISPQARNIWEQKLLLLPSSHPMRRALRDRIVESLVSDFNLLKEGDIDARLKLFEQALSLHDSSDFRGGLVAAQMAPMAMWVVDVFEKRGDEALVLSGLRFLMFVSPDDKDLQERYLTLLEWSKSVRSTIENPLERIDSLVELYFGVVQRVPDKEVVVHTAELLQERHRMVTAVFIEGGRLGSARIHAEELMIWRRILQMLPVNLIYVFFRIGEPAEARKYLEEFVLEDTVDVAYLELLDRVFQGADTAESYYKLANYLGYIDSEAELKACIIARSEDPNDPRYPLCVGRSFEKLDRPESAAVFYREAADIAAERDWYAAVSEFLWRVLLELHQAERVEAARRVIHIGTEMIHQALEKFPEDNLELRSAMGMLRYSMGEVEFDNGRMVEARRHLLDSYDILPDVRPLIKLVDIHYYLGDFVRGRALAEQALKLALSGEKPQAFWQAIILEKRGDLQTELNQKGEARASYQEALRLWQTSEVAEDRAPEAAFRRGVVLHRLGEAKASQESFRSAVRLDPERQGIYAQLISFLVMHRRLDDAIEFYRLAYNQDQIDGMWKIYYSLWIEGLSRRLGKGSYPMAEGYLEHSRGETWQDKLARFYTGAIAADALLKNAGNNGQRVEYEFYSALIALAQGRTGEARSKLETVIDSKLLGFFEYRMAWAILREELFKDTEPASENH